MGDPLRLLNKTKNSICDGDDCFSDSGDINQRLMINCLRLGYSNKDIHKYVKDVMNERKKLHCDLSGTSLCDN